MAGITTNYEFNLPEVDGSEDLWGDLLNQNWSSLDALLLARDQELAALEGRTLTAGDGLSGGGDLTQDRTLSVDSSVVRTSRSVSAGDGLTGGGDLSTDPTITMGTPGTLNGGTSNSVAGDSHTHAITSTASRTSSSTTTLLQAAGMNSHRTSGDHDARYARLAGGTSADFTSMPQVGGDPIVESGSNSDGEWTRWADGTQQTAVLKLHPNVDLSITSLQESTPAPHARPFIARPAVTLGPGINAHRVNLAYTGLDSVSVNLTLRASLNVSVTADVDAYIVALGRWK